MNLRELITEYILFAYDEKELMERFSLTEEEVLELSDVDLLEIYDTTLMFVEVAR